MRLPREPITYGRKNTLVEEQNLDRADGFKLRQIEDAMGQARDRYRTIVMAA